MNQMPFYNGMTITSSIVQAVYALIKHLDRKSIERLFFLILDTYYPEDQDLDAQA